MNTTNTFEFKQLKQELSATDQETFQDAEFAVEVLQMLAKVPEDEVGETGIEVNVKKLRNCLELMLSLLEAYENVNVKAMEDYQAVKDCLSTYPSDNQVTTKWRSLIH